MATLNQHHLIAKPMLSLEFYGSESEAMRVQQTLPQAMQQLVFPAIEKVLNRYSEATQHIIIDYLELDLGRLPLERLEQDLSQQVELCLEKALREKLLINPSVDGVNQTVAHMESAGIKVLSHAQSVLDAWIYFLRTGRLPWSFNLAQNKSLEAAVLEALPLLISSPSKLAEIKELLGNQHARQRLIYQFSNVFLAQLLLQLQAQAQSFVVRIYEQLSLLEIALADKKVLQEHLWLVVIEAAIDNIALEPEALWQKIAQLLQANAKAKSLSNHTLDKLLLLLKQSGLAKENPALLVLKAMAESSPTMPSATKPVQERPLSHILRNFNEASSAVAEAIYIDVAGVVLLHPFLPQYFAVLGIAVDDAIVQPSRAVCLLHYLCTGQTHPSEHALVLAKILCGVPISYPVERAFEPTPEEVTQTEKLLGAVIQYWDALKQTSIESLRGTFLIRTAKLSLKQDADWQLLVESKGFDILLASLPWSISMIKLPWMPYMLWVEWQS